MNIDCRPAPAPGDATPLGLDAEGDTAGLQHPARHTSRWAASAEVTS